MFRCTKIKKIINSPDTNFDQSKKTNLRLKWHEGASNGRKIVRFEIENDTFGHNSVNNATTIKSTLTVNL